MKASYINYLLSSCLIAHDVEMAYETILKYSDRKFYPNKNYKKINKIDDNNIIATNNISTMVNNIPAQPLKNVPQKNVLGNDISTKNVPTKNIPYDKFDKNKIIKNSIPIEDVNAIRLNRNLLSKNSYHIAMTVCGAVGDKIMANKIIDMMMELRYEIRIESFNALLNTVSKLHFILFLNTLN